jgi:hypothetical protein
MILLGIIYFGTVLVNYYYKFYHIYKFLDHEQKLDYFKNNCIVNIISKNLIFKNIIINYVLTPLIKINYVFILLFITLLYSLCHIEFNYYIKNEDILLKKISINDPTNKDLADNDINIKNKFNDISETSSIFESIDFTDNNISEQNINNENLELKNSKDFNNMEKEIENQKLSKEITDVYNITNDYDNNISNIMNFLSKTVLTKNKTDEIIKDTVNNIIKNNSENLVDNNLNDLNLSNEINILLSNKINQNKIDECDINNNLEDYLVIENVYNSEVILDNNKNIIYETIINEEISIDEINFGTNIEELSNLISTKSDNKKKEKNLNTESEIIRICKKKKKS